MSCITFPRRSKKNPYADRGLAQFALLSAELKAKRKLLLDRLGAPLCYVLFASGSSDQKQWIPILICPALSGQEARALNRSAMDLISEGGDSLEFSDGKSMQSGSSSGDSQRLSDLGHGKSSDDGRLQHAPAQIFASAEKLVWMAAYGLSIVADIACDALGLKASPPASSEKGKTMFAKQDIASGAAKHKSSAADAMAAHGHQKSSAKSAMAAHGHHTALPHRTAQGVSPATHRAKTRCSPHHPHAEKAPNMHIKWSKAGCFTAPSSPRGSRQPKKPLQASVSLPKSSTIAQPGLANETHLPNAQSPQSDIKHVEEFHVQRGSKYTVNKDVAKEGRDNYSQILAGAGVVMGLGGLFMGFVPAVVSIVCWWYLIPSWKKVAGAKPKRFKARHMEH